MANSALHEGLVALFRDRPGLAPTLLRDVLGAHLPPHDAIALGTEAIPAFNASPLACDAVLRLSHNGRPTSAILIEIQLRTDARKLYSWPVYVATARRALKVPVRLLVITPLPAVARWARSPIELSDHGSVLLPDVLGPENVPEITRAEDAVQAPQKRSALFEPLPIEAQLADGCAHRPELQITRAPVRHYRRLIRSGIEPLAVRTTGTPRQLLAAHLRQFARDLAIPHAASTKHSNTIGAPSASCWRLGGSDLPRSW